jgi:mono/diheme cytochrome c family protein
MPLALLLAVLAAADPGRALFDAHGCRACHAVGGIGGNAGPDLTYVGFRRPPDWLDRWLAAPRAWKSDTLMPDFKLARADRGALVAYLSSLKGDARLRGADGAELFARAGCVACHGPRGRGGQPNVNVRGAAIPALSAVAATYTRDELRAKIRRGSRPDRLDASGPQPVAMPPWGEILSEEQIDALAGYVLTLAPKDARKGDW